MIIGAGRREHRRPAQLPRVLTTGRRCAVAEIPGGIHFGGTLGWLGLHLVYLIGFRSRVLVLINWTWMYLRWDRANRVIVHKSE